MTREDAAELAARIATREGVTNARQSRALEILESFEFVFSYTMTHAHYAAKVLKEEYKYMPAPIMKYFAFDHLPPKLQEISEPVARLAQAMDAVLPDGAEKSAGLRKLLESKDCFVRAALES